MTLTSPETITQPDRHDQSLAVANFASLSPDLQRQWATLRREFMGREMNWHVEDDLDAYDDDPETRQFILQNDQGEITAGMRLTPRDSIQETLSWSMLPGLPAGAVEGLDGTVWDLTRLVPGAAKGHKERMAAFAQLFGAGLANNLSGGDANPCWIFATYPAFVEAFKHYGIEFTPVAGTERNGAQMYYAYPVERMNFLIDNQSQFSDAFANTKTGIEQASKGLLL